jgi:tetratricopeptide (TPR) repeat protein
METQSDLSELLANAEEDFKVSQNGVKTIETLKTFVGENQRFKTLLDDSVKLTSEEQQTLAVILTIGELYYDQSEDKTSARWFLKYLTKLKLETSFSEREKCEKSYTGEFMLGCCYYNLHNFKMALKCLKTSPPDPTYVNTYYQHCDMLIQSCQVLELPDEMLEYQRFIDENPSGIFNVKVRIANAKRLIQFDKIAAAKQHLKEASNILLQHQNEKRLNTDEEMLWVEMGTTYDNLLKSPHQAYKCNKMFVDSIMLRDPPPDFVCKVLNKMAFDCLLLLDDYQEAINISKYCLELVLENPEGHVLRMQTLSNIADSYYGLRDFGQSIQYNEECLEEMKKAYKHSDIPLDYVHLSKHWLRISRSQLMSGSYQIALKSAKKSEKSLKKLKTGKYPKYNYATAVQLSYCWRKLGHLQKAITLMKSTMEVESKLDKYIDVDFINHQIKLVYVGACEHQISGTFAETDSIFKSVLLQQSSKGLEEVMKTIQLCVKSGTRRRYRKVFPEDGQLFWSRIDYICRNDATFVSHLPNGFKKCFFQYKNSLEGCNHLFKNL